MDLEFTPYVIVMLSAAAVCLLIALYAWRHLTVHADRWTAFLMMLGITEWLITSSLGYADIDPAHKILWAKLEYAAVVSVPLMVLLFSINYSGLRAWLTRRNILLAFIVPAVTLVLAWTNELHGLIWSSYMPYLENGVMLSQKIYGPFFWVYWAYSYMALLIATILIIRTVILASSLFRGQAVLLILGILFPWAGNLLYIIHASPTGNLDLTPLLFFLTGAALITGLTHWRLFDIKPTAHVAIVENLRDGIIVLDRDNRIVDINPAARSFLRISALEALGKKGEALLPADLFTIQPGSNDNKTRAEIKTILDNDEKYFDLTGTLFQDKTGAGIGRIIIVHDVTAIRAMQQKLARIEHDRMELRISESEQKYWNLFNNASDAIFISDTDTGIILDANKQAEILLGRSREEIINMHRSRLHPEDKTEYYENNFRDHCSHEKVLDYNAEIVRKNGNIVPVSISAGVLMLNGKMVIQGIFRDMTEKVLEEELLKKSQARIIAALEKTVESMGIVTAIRDPFTQMHQSHVAQLVVSIGAEIGLSSEKIKALEIAALIHDVGKIYVPADILSKPGRLSAAEFDIVKMHVEAAQEILKPIEFPWPIMNAILQHHERLNGSGYPKGLKGDDICIEGRIMAVADVVEAMTSHRPYRPALDIDQALADIEDNKGILYDTEIVDSCVRIFREKNFRFNNPF